MPRALNSFDQRLMEKTDNYSGLTSSQFAPNLAMNNFIASGEVYPTQPSDVVSDGLIMYLDAAIGNSYPQAGNTWFDLAGSSTNFIRNNTMAGAVAGTPGTIPTNWSISGDAGITREIVGTGTSNGITYIDIRYSGTTPAVGGLNNINLDSLTAAAAVNGQSWTFLSYFAIVGGTTTGVTGIRQRVSIWSSTPTYLGELVATPADLTSIITSSLHDWNPHRGQ
jgi:hypothetical protein